MKGVRELALLGAADLSWWRDHLADEELEPIERDGRAQVLVSGLTSKWMGIPFRELSVAVAARYRSDSAEEGFFLARGFNTSRFFAGFERWWFHTPYRYRPDLHVELQCRAVISLGGRSTADLLAELGPREPAGSLTSAQEMSFEGPLFIPTGRDRSRRRWFMARIQGLTYTFDFEDNCDRFALASRSRDPILVGLQTSQFRGVQWQLRPNAAHARSKTFQARR